MSRDLYLGVDAGGTAVKYEIADAAGVAVGGGEVPTNPSDVADTLRSLAADDVVTKALDTLKGKAKVKRAMWSRRAQEYEQKINSGDLLSIAEVVRDLHRADDQREQSYSERQLYEAALERLTREVAAVSGVDEAGAAKQVDSVLVSRVAA